MEDKSEEKQQIITASSVSPKKPKFFSFSKVLVVIFILVVLVLVGEGVYYFMNSRLFTSKNKKGPNKTSIVTSSQLLSSLPKNNYFVRSDDSGVDILGTIKEFDPAKQKLIIDIKDSKFTFDVSSVSQVFILKDNCDDLLDLCKDQADSSLKLIDKNDDLSLLFKNGSKVRLFINKGVTGNISPEVSQIILKSK